MSVEDNKTKGAMMNIKFELGLFAVAMLCIVALVFYTSHENDKLRVLMDSDRTFTEQDQALIEKYKNTENVSLPRTGSYQTGEKLNGFLFIVSYEFDKGRLKKTYREYKGGRVFTGTAAYTVQGSVMMFNDVKGPAYLFPQAGEPISLKSDREFELLLSHQALVSKQLLEERREQRQQEIDSAPWSQTKGLGLVEKALSKNNTVFSNFYWFSLLGFCILLAGVMLRKRTGSSSR